ncbi:hypothetical protein [Micromonospora sp. NPDC050495]|uniref:hypothetical protein n=1 Tax=Micromonospora sp. NPDC050495 TaxID=3154936 RepID=UPI0033ECD099
MAKLMPAPRSIVNGDEAASVVSVCCLRQAGVSRLAVSLMVDEVTARRFARTCRLGAWWGRWMMPSVLVAAAVILLLAVVDAVGEERRLLSVALVLAQVLAAVTLVGRLVLSSLASRHHPRLKVHGVLIRSVDREVAEVWADLNPRGAIEILG